MAIRSRDEVEKLVESIREGLKTTGVNDLCHRLHISKDYYYNLCYRYKIKPPATKVDILVTGGLNWVHAPGVPFLPCL